MLASFFYQGDVPEPETLLDMARQALVAESSGDGDFDAETCTAMIGGLVRAWAAARSHVDESWEPALLDRREAEGLYCKVGLRVYVQRVQRDYPHYECEVGDGVIWWPEGLSDNYDAWPKEFITKLAQTIGEIEGDRSVAMFRYMQEQAKAAS